MITDDDVKKAIANIARTPEGLLLYRYLQREVMGLPTSEDEGALLISHGHRKFAAKLMAFMAEGIDSGERTGSDTSGISQPERDRPVVFTVKRSAEVATGQRGPGRRVTADTVVPGFDTPKD